MLPTSSGTRLELGEKDEPWEALIFWWERQIGALPGPSVEEAGLCATVSRGRAGGGRPLQGRCMVRARHGNGRTVPNGTQPTEIFGVCFNNSQNKDSPWVSHLWAVVGGAGLAAAKLPESNGLWAQPTHLCANESRGGGSGDERCCRRCSSSGECEFDDQEMGNDVDVDDKEMEPDVEGEES